MLECLLCPGTGLRVDNTVMVRLCETVLSYLLEGEYSDIAFFGGEFFKVIKIKIKIFYAP